MTAENTFSNISAQQQKKLDKLCDHFEARLGGQKRPKIEAYLEKVAEPLRRVFLRELLLLEVEFLSSLGNVPQHENYRRRFAGYEPVVNAVFNAEGQETGDYSGHTYTRNSVKTKGSPTGVATQIGRYQIEEPLGSGAFGVVYRAHDPQLDRKVALKVPHEVHLSNPQFVKRFLNESKACACLQHPHIVPVFDAGKDDQSYFIASGFIEGKTLGAVIGEAALDFRKTARIVLQLAKALAYAHKQGIVHRDVKPGNVMLDTNGEPHLMDFGLARLETSEEKLTQDGSLLGTPAYMSPEQTRPDVKAVGPASDQYNLGVLLYEMLCGLTPFTGPLEIVIYNVRETNPPAPHSVRKSVPRDLETICLKAMSKDVQLRYADCEHLAEDLRRWQVDEPIRARRASLAVQSWKWARRNRALAYSLGTVILALVLGITGVTIALNRAKVEERNALAAAERAEAAETKMRAATVNLRGALNRERKASEMEGLARRLAEDASNLAADARKKAEGALVAKKAALSDALEARTAESKARGETVGALRRAERELSLNRITLAMREWQASNLTRTIQLLDECHPEHRHWEWWYLNELCHRDNFTFADAHEGRSVNSVVFTPDGKRLLSGGDDHQVRIWDLATRKPKGAFRVFNRDNKGFSSGKAVRKIVCFADGTTIAASNYEGRAVAVCDLRTGEERFRMNEMDRVLTISSDGAVAVWHNRERTKTVVWSIANGKRKCELDGTYPVAAVSPDTKQVATGSYTGEITIFDSVTSDSLGKVSLGSHVRLLTFSPDGTRLAAFGYKTGQSGAIKNRKPVTILDVKTGRKVIELNGDSSVLSAIAFSPDGARLLTGGDDNTVRLWDVETGLLVRSFRGHKDGVTSVAFAPNGERFATASGDGAIKVWPLHKSNELYLARLRRRMRDEQRRRNSKTRSKPVSRPNETFLENAEILYGHRGAVRSVTFNDDGSRLASGGVDKSVRIWDTSRDTQELTFDLPRAVSHVRFSPDGDFLAVVNPGSLNFFNPKTGQRLNGSDLDSLHGITDLEFTPDGSRCALATFSPTVPLMMKTVPGGDTVFSLPRNGDSIVTFCPDGTWFATCGMYQQVTIWDAKSGAKRRNLQFRDNQDGGVHVSRGKIRLAAAPNGRWLAVAFGGRIEIWNIESGEKVRVLSQFAGTEAGLITDLDFTPDNQRLVTAGSDGVVRLWELVTGINTLALHGHEKQVSCLAISKDGRRIASGSDDGTVRVWDAGPKFELLR